MDADLGRTSSGKLCKKCVKKGSKCSQHGGTPSPQRSLSHKSSRSPQSPRSPKRRAPNVFSNLPCSILLNIAKKLDPSDYINLSAVSYEIDLCLSEGRYKSEKEEGKLKAAQKELLKNEFLMIRNHPRILSEIRTPSDAILLELIKAWPYNISVIPNPSEKLQLAAVKLNGNAIASIKNPSEAVMLAAVRQTASAIEYIPYPSEEVQLAALRQDENATEYFTPSDKVMARFLNL